MKKKLSLLLLICILSALNINAEIYNGSCGENVNYSLNTETGLLSITGTGDMTDYYTMSDIPWYSQMSKIKSVEISEGVTRIGERTFLNCTSLTNVSMPNSLTSIGYCAFAGCSALNSVIIPNNVTSIGKGGFQNCSGLVSLSIGNSVTAIGSLAFQNCPLLKEVIIPNSVKSIGNNTFEGCIGLTSIDIPNGVIYIGYAAFQNCSGITSINIPNSVYYIGDCAFDGTAWNENLPEGLIYVGKVFYKYKGVMPENTSVTITEGTIGIAGSAFEGCSGLISVTIPNTIKSIAYYAFRGCSNLAEVYCKAEKNPTTGGDMLNGVPLSNATLYVPEVSLEKYQSTEPWSGFGTIKTIEEVEKIVSGSCGENVNYTLNLETGEMKITGTGAMTDYTSENRAPWYEQREYIKSVEISEGVTRIGERIFWGCSNLASLIIPNNVTTIGAAAFVDCPGLTSISVESGNTNYDSRENCNAIIETATNTLIVGCKNTVIPGSVTAIGSSAFSRCSSLTSIIIPNSVKSIDQYAFDYTGLTSIIIPNSVTEIGDQAFVGCSSLTDVYCYAENVPNTNKSGFGKEVLNNATLYVPEVSLEKYQSTEPWSGFGTIKTIEEVEKIVSGSCGEDVNYTLNLETGVLSITGTGAMTDYSSEEEVPWYEQRGNIKTIEIADGVTTIGNNAFNGCSGLTSLTMPNSVTSIGEWAFTWCDHLTSFDIPNSVTSIGDHAFERCDNLSSLTIGNSVTSIGSFAFEQCSFTSIIIPSSVTSMGEKVFAYCTHLTSIVVADGNMKYDSRDNCNAIIETATNTMVLGCKNTIIPNSVTSIGSDAFYTCTELTSIEIPSSVTSIGRDAFGRCYNLTSITIPNSVTSIEAWAFDDCYSLTSVTIPNSVTSIQACAFNRTGLTSVEIPNSVTSIEERVFEDCSGLTSIDIPNSVTSIGYAAFNRSGLTSVTIPNSVTSIRELAFSNCSSLTEVYCYAEDVPNTSTDAFDNVDLSNATLYVPAASIEAYKAAEPWSQFANITKLETDISQLENVIYVESLDGHSDSQIALPIQMKNSAAIRGFQFDIYLPEGVTVVKSAKGKILASLTESRLPEDDEHTLTLSEQGDGSIRFLCGSLYDEKFTGNDGEIATLTVKIDENMSDGDYPIILRNIKLTESDISKYYETPLVRSTLSVVSYMLGDINGDGKIDVSDYIGIANHILGNTPEDFVLKAADVNEDGLIDVSDYIGVANIILSGSIYGSQQ